MRLDIPEMVDQSKIDNQVESSKTREILLQVELFEPDIRNPAMLETCKIHILNPPIQAQNLGSQFSKKSTDIAMTRAELKYLLPLKIINAIYFEKLVASPHPPVFVRCV